MEPDGMPSLGSHGGKATKRQDVANMKDVDAKDSKPNDIMIIADSLIALHRATDPGFDYDIYDGILNEGWAALMRVQYALFDIMQKPHACYKEIIKGVFGDEYDDISERLRNEQRLS
jgi:hypothetical protein